MKRNTRRAPLGMLCALVLAMALLTTTALAGDVQWLDSEIEAVDGFSDGLALARRDGKWGYLDEGGRTVIDFAYEDGGRFSDGLAPVKKDGKWGYIDKTGKTIIPFVYDGAGGFSDGLAPVEKDDRVYEEKWGFIDRAGREIIPFLYDDAGSFSGGLAPVEKGGRWGYIDKSCKTAISFLYEDARPFSEELAAVKRGEQWGYLNAKGKLVIPARFDGAGAFSGGLAPVEKDERWGYIDAAGREAIGLDFDRAGAFSGGLAPVERQGKWGYVDGDSRLAVTPEYGLAQAWGQAAAPVMRDGRWGLLAAAREDDAQATRSTSAVYISGKKSGLQGYVIGGSTYYKLRDLAQALSGTSAQFAVSWDAAAQSISLSSGKAYAPVGGELRYDGTSAPRQALPSEATLLVDGKRVTASAYQIDGNNYYKLRDLASALGFDVSWDGGQNRIDIRMGPAKAGNTMGPLVN